MGSDVLLLADVFKKIITITIQDIGINSLFCVSLPGHTWQCGFVCTDIRLQTLQVREVISSLFINIWGVISSVMGDWYIKSDEKKTILFTDANLYVWAMNDSLHDDEIKLDKNVELEDLLNTNDVTMLVILVISLKLI